MTIAPSLTSADLAVALAATRHGDVVTPDDPSYPAACFGIDSAGESAPEIVVIAADAGDVAAAIRLAARTRRRGTVQATGHTAPVAGAGKILVVTRLLARVSIDPQARTARVGAGSSWRQVLAAARAFGLARSRRRSVPPPRARACGRSPSLPITSVNSRSSPRQARSCRLTPTATQSGFMPFARDAPPSDWSRR